MKFLDLGLYYVSSQELSSGRKTIDVVKDAVEGGLRTIQLREKEMSTREKVKLGKDLRIITREHNIYFLVNDRVDIALAVEADGIHLGQDDMPLEDARRLMGDDAIIGLSVDTVEEAVSAEQAGADYVGLGPMFKTGTKSDTGPVVGPEGVALVKPRITVPLVAIGGINLDNAKDVLLAGADSLAVVTSLSMAEDIKDTAKRFNELMNKYRG